MYGTCQELVRVVITINEKLLAFSSVDKTNDLFRRPFLRFAVHGVEHVHASSHEAGAVEGEVFRGLNAVVT